MHDLVIRNGLIVDGTGNPGYEADLAIENGKIAAIGPALARGREEIDAKGRIVTPGFVDIHTHYDAQATWDPVLQPSGGHGVTTLVMGNCGVGFAPARADRHDWLIGVMEGVEDIPGTALSAGLQWNWESFAEYLDALDVIPRAVDIGAQVPHSAVRAYVMDQRVEDDFATADDIEAMARIVEDGIRAGALGFTTSRTRTHKTNEGKPVPGTFAPAEEMIALGRALKRGGGGIFQMVSDHYEPRTDFAWMEQISAGFGVPLHFLMMQFPYAPDRWYELMTRADIANSRGADISALVSVRPLGGLVGLESERHHLSGYPSYRAIAHLPLDERVRLLRDPALKAKILSEESQLEDRWWRKRLGEYEHAYPLGEPCDYEPTPDSSVAAIAKREGRRPEDVVYDMLLRRNGRELMLMPFYNYVNGDLTPQLEMISHPNSLFALGDGGAHCGVICDASAPTHLLTHWVRDRTRGPRIALETAVHYLTARNAAAYGFADRGRLALGLKADINVIDSDHLTLGAPYFTYDLPADGRRLLQDARGYDATICAGAITWREGKPTGARPGKLVRRHHG